MKLFYKINWHAFIISLSIGLFLCYITFPQPKIVVKFPTPENAGSVIYLDDSGNCYKYEAKEVNCPKDMKGVLKNPLEIQ
tara:strand:- start:279 stop:518 length:240 start_codon:yes stop_codon:yes gene_type:complete